MRSLHRHALIVRFVAGLAALAVPATLHAQQQPIVFVHGLHSSGGTWTPAAAMVEQEFDAQVLAPTQDWKDTYPEQASELQRNSQVRELPDTTIAFGHSNGGVVAREWSKIHGLDGIATIGTPHQGAPFVSHVYDWVNFNDSARVLDEGILNAFGSPYNQQLYWVLGALNEGISWSRWVRGYVLYETLAAFGFDIAAPVLSQMRPPSAYLAALNSDGNVAREAQGIAHRVGIVNVPNNFLFGGPVRLMVSPEYVDDAVIAMQAAGAIFYYYGAYLQSQADPRDIRAAADANDKSNRLMQLGQWINEIDLTWCSMVSSTGPANGRNCVPNDSLVPWNSQVYPGAYNAVFHGASHTYETRYSGDAIFWALHDVMGVQPPPTSPRPPAPPSPEPPPPDPPASPDPEDPSNPAPEPRSNILGSFEVLYSDNWRVSANGRYRLYYQSDGNLVLLRDERTAIWSTKSSGRAPGTLTMQGDGNLVVLDDGGRLVWSSSTWGNDGAYLVVANDGSLVISRPDGSPLWATKPDGGGAR